VRSAPRSTPGSALPPAARPSAAMAASSSARKGSAAAGTCLGAGAGAVASGSATGRACGPERTFTATPTPWMATASPHHHMAGPFRTPMPRQRIPHEPAFQRKPSTARQRVRGSPRSR